jgi:tetratricopeptide (TPR) repeat protein
MLPSEDPIGDAIARGMSALRAGRGDEALVAFGEAEAAARAAGDDAGVSSALRHASLVWRQRSDWERAATLARRAADVAREAGLREPLAEALNAEAIVHQSRGAFDDAVPLLEESSRTAAERRTVAVARANLGSIAAQRGNLDVARAQFMEAARGFRSVGDAFGEALVLNNFGRSGIDAGNARVAMPMLEDALGAARRAGDDELTAIVRRNLAEAYGMLGRRDEARVLAEEALAVFTAEGNQARRAECLRILGELAQAAGDSTAAERFLHEAYSVAAASDARTELDRIAARISSGGRSEPTA